MRHLVTSFSLHGTKLLLFLRVRYSSKCNRRAHLLFWNLYCSVHWQCITLTDLGHTCSPSDLITHCQVKKAKVKCNVYVCILEKKRTLISIYETYDHIPMMLPSSIQKHIFITLFISPRNFLSTSFLLHFALLITFMVVQSSANSTLLGTITTALSLWGSRW